MFEKASELKPITSATKIGDQVLVNNGPLKGSLAIICELPLRDRVEVFIHFLGSLRKTNILLKDVKF